MPHVPERSLLLHNASEGRPLNSLVPTWALAEHATSGFD